MLRHFSALSPSMYVSSSAAKRNSNLPVSLPELVNHQNCRARLAPLQFERGPATEISDRTNRADVPDSRSQFFYFILGRLQDFKWHSDSELRDVMVTQVSPARWDGLFAYPTVKLLTDVFLGRPHDGFLREEGQKFATTKVSEGPFTVRCAATCKHEATTANSQSEGKTAKKKIVFSICSEINNDN